MANQHDSSGGGEAGAAPSPGVPGPAQAPDWFAGLIGSLVSPAQMMATVQQLNHNLEMLQAGMVEMSQLNAHLETMGPELKELTATLNSIAERIWPKGP